MDGIGGIIIGNVFKVQKSKLPRGYQGDEVAFATFGITHKVTAGQDWTTEINGNMFMLDIPNNAENINIASQAHGNTISKEELLDYNWNGYLTNIGIDPNDRAPDPLVEGEIYADTWENTQGDEADYWTLMAVCITESNPPSSNFSDEEFKQSVADIAQSIYNRYQMDQQRITLGFSNGEPYYGKKHGPGAHSVKSIMIGPTDGHMAWAAYEVSKGNEDLWMIIKDGESAITAMMAYSTGAGIGYTDTLLYKMIGLAADALNSPELFKNSRTFLEGRTEYRAEKKNRSLDIP